MSKVAKSVTNLAHCQCTNCPSFSLYCRFKTLPEDTLEAVEGIEDQKHYEGLFCAFEKSDCIHSEHGCKCGDCEVAKDNHLHKHYYCLHNAED